MILSFFDPTIYENATSIIEQAKPFRLSSAWRLGDCNDKFVIMLVNKAGELLYIHKGEMSKEEQERFIEIADKLR